MPASEEEKEYRIRMRGRNVPRFLGSILFRKVYRSKIKKTYHDFLAQSCFERSIAAALAATELDAIELISDQQPNNVSIVAAGRLRGLYPLQLQKRGL